MNTYLSAPARILTILVNWNCARHTVACVRSLALLSDTHTSILVVDNGSTDDSLQHLAEQIPEIRIIETKQNLGYAGGNNVGLRAGLAEGYEYFWILNPDVIVHERALSALLESFSANPKLGIAGSIIYTHNIPLLCTSQYLQFNGGGINMRTGNTFSMHTRNIFPSKEHDYNVEWATGCSLLVSRTLIEKIGLLPEEYFLNYEETEYCVRAERAGFEVRVNPGSIVWHERSAVLVPGSPTYYYYMHRNRFMFMKRNASKWEWYIFIPRYLLFTSSQLLLGLRRWRSQSFRLFSTILQATRDAFLGKTGKTF